MRLPYRDLQTERLHLRRPREGDAPLVFDSFGSDPEVARYLTWRPHQTVADAEAALAARLERLERETEYSWILELSDSGRVVGLISAWCEADSVEVGFVLARPCWRQGLTTEALLAVTHWALTAPGVKQVWATCDVENGASARVLEKAGFRSCGEFERPIIRPNLGPEPRPSLLFRARRSTG